MNFLGARHLVIFTFCSRQVSAKDGGLQQQLQQLQQELNKGLTGKPSADDQQNGKPSGGNSDNSSHMILETSIKVKNGTTVEYDLDFVRNNSRGVAYDLTYAKKSTPDKLTDIPEESDRDDGE